MIHLPIGALDAGTAFRTSLTGRTGIVLEKANHHKSGGVAVALDKPDEEKLLHQDVLVEVEG